MPYFLEELPFSILEEEKLIPKSYVLTKKSSHFVNQNEIFYNKIFDKSYLELIQFIEQNKHDEQIKFLIFPELIKDLEQKENNLIDKMNVKILEINELKNILTFWLKKDELTYLNNLKSANRKQLILNIDKIKKIGRINDTALVLLNKCLDIKIKLNQQISQVELSSIMNNNSNREFILKSKRLVLKKFYLFEYI